MSDAAGSSDVAPNESGASATGSNRTRAESIPGIERATGREWSAWVTLFEAQGAPTLQHPAIAKIARAALTDELRNPDWWAQAIAIAYEQHAGLRVPGQSSSGTFRVSASRTLPFDRDAAIEAWRTAHGARRASILQREIARRRIASDRDYRMRPAAIRQTRSERGSP